MFKYWVKNRMLLDVLLPIILVVVAAFAFIVPIFNNLGEARLNTSLYENEKLNFDIPSPSYDQVSQLENETFIESVFPYFYTKVNLYFDGKARQTNLFFSDTFDKLEQTMYCKSRLIETAKQNFSNPILVDYQFVQDTGVKIGSTVSVLFGTDKIDFQVYAIYETNIYYDGGAVMAKWEGSQKEAIMALSPKLVYSGAYVQAADRQQCKNYFEKEYKPYGRLKDRSDFATQEAYDIHYNAFISANYANEITDFSVRGLETFTKAQSQESVATLYTILSNIIIAIVLIVYNLLMGLRKSESGYFSKRKVSGGGNAVVYYLISIFVQAVLIIGGMTVVSFVAPSKMAIFIPSEIIISKSIIYILASALIAVIVAIENMVLAQKTKK